ncbi:MAG TPA: 3-hydroxyacyl-ACP dehydratase FabZ family protein [Pirellulales bacterium]|jgi:3-hydroxyacyl-[acyl-carrier-protein] dehydratase|nr:3-hydroxyacyl-ACP dehydratase FabZ family protein [Pirellulales bacterium]
MRFTLIDRIDQLEPGASIRAVKSLSLAEEYLADHFPRFPVMPGVLMLEAMTQAGAWLIRASEDFAHSMVVLKEARNVKYSDFVSPGQTLCVTAEITGQDEVETKLKAQGTVDGQTKFTARLVLERYNLVERGLGAAETDGLVTRQMRALFALLHRPAAVEQSAKEAISPHGVQSAAASGSGRSEQ